MICNNDYSGTQLRDAISKDVSAPQRIMGYDSIAYPYSLTCLAWYRLMTHMGPWSIRTLLSGETMLIGKGTVDIKRYDTVSLQIIHINIETSPGVYLLSRGRKSLATLTLRSSKINQHCWRFHGSGVIAAPQIIGLISFCTGMHHDNFLRSSMCFRVPHLCSKINNWTGEFATVIWRLHCFTVSFRGDIRGESGPR